MRVGLLYLVLAGLGVYAAVTDDPSLAEIVADALFLPVVAAGFYFAYRGAGTMVALSTLVVVVLSASGVVEPEVAVANVALCGLLGFVIGWSASRLRAQSAMLARSHDLTPELLATVRDGIFVDVNPAWHHELGYRESDLLGTPLLDLVHPDDRDRIVENRERLARGEPFTPDPARMRHADGRYRWIEWAARHDFDDEVNYIAGRDITAKREAEQVLSLHKEMLEKAVVERTAELQARTDELERLARELDMARREHLRRLAIAAEFRDDKTAQHTERVGIAAALIARELGLPEPEIRLIREAAPLHDIGKIGTPDAILLNPQSLTEAEWLVMQQHTHLGAKILGNSGAPVLQMAAEIALNHHEWWNGTGYPGGVAGEDIPLPARIVALADVLDALTHARPYKPAWTLEQATHEIESLSGTQFDPSVVAAFRHLDAKDLTRLLQLEGDESAPLRVAAGY